MPTNSVSMEPALGAHRISDRNASLPPNPPFARGCFPLTAMLSIRGGGRGEEGPRKLCQQLRRFTPILTESHRGYFQHFQRLSAHADGRIALAKQDYNAQRQTEHE